MVAPSFIAIVLVLISIVCLNEAFVLKTSPLSIKSRQVQKTLSISAKKEPTPNGYWEGEWICKNSL